MPVSQGALVIGMTGERTEPALLANITPIPSDEWVSTMNALGRDARLASIDGIVDNWDRST
jgi:hypothetical protein